jgi:energy-coupling factor transport system permease protein
LLLILALIAGASVWDNVRKLWPLVALPVLYCLLLWPLFVTGRTPWLSLGSHLLTREAVEYGLGMGLRLSLMVLGGILLLSTTTIEEFTLALQRLGLPAAMGFALSLAFRWVPSLIGAAGLIVQAQRSRGLDVGAGHALARLRRYPPLLVPLIGHTLRHTRFLAMALESKGFGPGVRRQELVAFRLRIPDYVALTCVTLLVGFSLWLRVAGYGGVDVRF